MLIPLGLFILILFGSHALLEYLTGGYHDRDKDCKFHRKHHRHNWFDDDSLFDDKTIK
jgi:hypothetical protein